MKLNGLSRPALPVPIGILLLLLATLAGSSVDNHGIGGGGGGGSGIKTKNPESSLTAGNNGALKLIVQAYVDSILRDIQKDGGTSLSGPIVDEVRNRMRRLPQHLQSHPAIMEKRLWIGPNQPSFDPYLFNDIDATNLVKEISDQQPAALTQNSNRRKIIDEFDQLRPAKRTGSVNRNAYLAEEICGTDRQWELINRTTDFDAHEVEIIHTEEFRQYLFVYRCVAPRGPCLGISPLYNSECEMRYGWVNMYHRRLDIPDSPSQWGFVAVPHHCACKITPKFIGREK